MPYSPIEKRIIHAYFYRKIRTFPFFIMIFVSFALACTGSFEWVKGKMTWHQTEAVITFATQESTMKSGYQYTYICEKDESVQKGSIRQPMLFWNIPYGKLLQVDSVLQISYKPDDPKEHVVFVKLESYMITWWTIFVLCFIIYFWLEAVLKKKAESSRY